MKSLKFLRNVAVYGIHREQGSVHDIEDRDSVILIADRSAELFEKPTAQVIENAIAKPSKKETAAKR